MALSLGAAVLLLGLLAVRWLAPPTASPVSPAATGFVADIVIPPNTSPAPDFTLRDQNNQPVSITSVRGRVVALTFLDSHCKQLCPLEADQLAQVQGSLGKSVPLSVLVVSVAPATDTPASERAFAAEHHWTGDWHWLTGTQAQLAAVWKAYSIAVQISPEDIIHSSVLYLIDRGGYERAGFAAGLVPDLVARDVRYLAA
jgi:protein SCO1/2